MADRYWVGASGSGWLVTSSWSATSGGAGGASIPTSTDNAIFDRATTYTVSASTGQTLNCANFTVSAGTVTFSIGAAALLIYGNFSVVAATIWSNQSGSIQFVGNGTQNITTNGTNIQYYVVFGGNGTYQLQDNFLLNPPTTNRSVNFTGGTLDLNNKTLSCIVFTSSNTNTRSIAFGTSGKISLRGARGTTVTTIFDTSTSTNLSTSGTALIEVVNSNSTSANQILAPGTLGESQAFSLNVTAGTGTTISIFPTSGSGNTWNNVNFTGYAGSLGNHIYAGSVVYGDWTFSTGMTVDNSGLSTVITFAKTSGTQTITSNGKSFNCPLTFDGDGGTFFLADALSVSASTTIRTLTLVNGTFDGNSKTITNASSGVFSSTGTVTIKNISTALGFTMTSGALTQGAANTFGVVTLNNGTFDGAGYLLSGASGITMATGSVTAQNINTARAFTHTSGSLTLSGTNSIASSTYAHNGGTLTLAVNTSISTYTTTNGTLDLAGYTLTVPSYVTAAGTKNLTFNGGTLIVTNATTTAFNNAVPTGFTTTAGTGTGKISMTAATAKTFVGGGSTYNCNLSNDGAGALTISGSNAFFTITNTVTPVTFTFTSGTTQTLGSSFSFSGTAGNLVTLNATVSGTRATIARSFNTTSAISFDSYLSIKDMSFSPLPAADGSTPYVWYFGTTSTNAGNNDGAAFTDLTNIIYRITTTTAGNWTVPSNWNSTNNKVYLIGGGGGGRQSTSPPRQGGAGGGGGGFTLVQNFSTSSGSSISYSVGAGGAANGGAGGATTWSSGAYSAGGGAGGTSPTAPGAGGTGSTYNGGTGGVSGSGGTTLAAGGGGGGGAGGPSGAGATGGNANFNLTTTTGGGGGGNGGGSAGATPNGGNNFSGIGGATTAGSPGSFGGGGAGGIGTGVSAGGAASTGIEILNTIGSGSGGAGAGATTLVVGVAGTGGLYGGGGAGGAVNPGGTTAAGAAGAQGVIIIVYSTGNTGAFFFMF